MEEPASMRESQHLMLTRPCDRRIEQAGDSDSARQPTIDSGLDEAWCFPLGILLNDFGLPIDFDFL
jgi:hypothetical protein